MALNRVLDRLNSLISAGGEVLATQRSAGQHVVGPDRVESAIFSQWRTSSLAFLNTLPHEFVYLREFEEHCKIALYQDAVNGLGILQAAKEDIEGGYLQRVETFVSASVFSDFLEMAEYLLNNGYKDPAASLIGAVLEDGLRRICVNNGITLKKNEDISALNQRVAQKQVYNPLQQKQIQVWNDVRNNADHGQFNQYKSDDVKEMLGGVQKFLSSYLT